MHSGEWPDAVALTGQTIGHYRVEGKLGEGGVGEVYRAVDTQLGRTVAIKRLRPELAARPHIFERFRSEARTLAQLSHPNIATLYGLEGEGDALFMVMEFIEGKSIWSILQRHRRLSPEQAFAIFFQTLDGIGYVHSRGIVHRDIKGSNLLIDRETVVKVVDFGIARALGSERLTRGGQMVGTPEFMSPEQVRGEEPDLRSDVYSLGILANLLLAGRVPFEARGEYEMLRAHVESAPIPLSEMIRDLPAELDGILLRTLEKDPAERFQSVDALRSALARFVDERWVRAGEPLRSASLFDLVGESSDDPQARTLSRGSRFALAEPTCPLLDEAGSGSPGPAQSPHTGSDEAPTAVTSLGSRVRVVAANRSGWGWLAWAALVALLIGVNWLRASEESPSRSAPAPEAAIANSVHSTPSPSAAAATAAGALREKSAATPDAAASEPLASSRSESSHDIETTLAKRTDPKHTSRGRQSARHGRAASPDPRGSREADARREGAYSSRESETRSGWKILRR